MQKPPSSQLVRRSWRLAKLPGTPALQARAPPRRPAPGPRPPAAAPRNAGLRAAGGTRPPGKR
eukprot:9439759-Heterocapsa_arctica.AAC.1